MNETPVVRIQRASIKNFRNVEFGEIRFPCNYGEDPLAPKADVLGIYGQNGSGKSITTQSFIPFILDGDRTPGRLDPFGSAKIVFPNASF